MFDFCDFCLSAALDLVATLVLVYFVALFGRSNSGSEVVYARGAASGQFEYSAEYFVIIIDRVL